MDNNKKVQLDRIEYENMHMVKEVNKGDINKNQVNTNAHSSFSEFMKKAQSSSKKSSKSSYVNKDIVVESSLKVLIDAENEVNKFVEEKIASSENIKKLLSREETTPIKNELIKEV